MVAGAVLLAAVLVGVLAYHAQMLRYLVGVNRDLAQTKLEAASIAADLRSRVGELTEMTRKLYLTGDPVYGDRLTQLSTEFGLHLARLDSVTRSPAEASALAALRQLWEEGEVGGGMEVASLPSVKQLKSGLPAAAVQEIGELVEEIGRLDQLERSFELSRLELLGRRVDSALQATKQAIQNQTSLVANASSQARRVSWSVAAAALLMTFVVGFVTIRSINEPLKRLIAGTRAVAEGRFTYQLDDSRGDEFARLAASFNKMVRRLDALDQMKKQFLAHVSHELKTPLTAMHETNQLLLEQIPGPLTAKQRRLVTLNLESGRRLSAMISKLLDLSHMEAGGLELDLKPRDLVALTRLVVVELETRLAERRIELQVDMPQQPVRLRLDGDRLIQVIENLLENALKFSPVGAPLAVRVVQCAELPREVPASLRPKLGTGGFAMLSIADRGIGVPDEHKVRIFEKFQQGGAAARRAKGSVGLGLAICREIVDAHGGAIWVVDNPDGGSVFHLLLPSGGSPTSRPPKPAGGAEREGGNER